MRHIQKSILLLALVVGLTACSEGGQKQKATQPGEENPANTTTQTVSTPQGQPIHLTQDEFIEKVFDFRNGGAWSYKGDKPCVVDFYADWCGPCRTIAPFMTELATTYAGKIYVYKVNTDHAQDLARALGINSIPMVLMVPQQGNPMRIDGARPKDDYDSAIQSFLLPAKS